MDLALRYSRDLDAYDLVVDALAPGMDRASADLLQEDTLVSAVIVSLMADRLAAPNEVPAGTDRRGWWADAYAQEGDRTGSRLWLLQRTKQLPETLQRARTYIGEALQWLVDDGFVDKIDLVVFTPAMGWLVAEVILWLDGESRRYRFEWNMDADVWRLAGEKS